MYLPQQLLLTSTPTLTTSLFRPIHPHHLLPFRSPPSATLTHTETAYTTVDHVPSSPATCHQSPSRTLQFRLPNFLFLQSLPCHPPSPSEYPLVSQFAWAYPPKIKLQHCSCLIALASTRFSHSHPRNFTPAKTVTDTLRNVNLPSHTDSS